MSDKNYVELETPLGIDGRQLNYNPYSLWKIWNYEEIYFGEGSPQSALYVPKVNDLIIHLEEGREYIVTAIDPVSYVPSIKPFYRASKDEVDGEEYNVLGVGVGSQNDLFRAYVNKNTMPYSVMVDQRLWVGGSDTKYAICFRGSPTVGTPTEVISIMYDTNSSLVLGNEIPLEEVVGPDYTNCKTVKPFYTKIDLEDNEYLTIIFYNSQNTPVARTLLLVDNTAWIRDQTDEMKYVKDIFLESPFISSALPNLISYPLNLPINALNLFGTVLYSDGSQRRLPVNGNKFTMMGKDSFVATYPNQTDQWVLRYQLDKNEAVEGAIVNSDYYVTKPYDVKVTQVDEMFSVKLYGYPFFRDAVNGYGLRWYLYTLNRQTWIDVTHLVKVGGNSRAWDPLLYGVNQQINWVLEMRDVDPSYGDWVHTEVVNFSLYRPGTENTFPRWTTRFQGDYSPFGTHLQCKYKVINENLYEFSLRSDILTKAVWLREAYRRTYPLYDRYTELAAPDPDYAVIKFNNAGGTEEYVLNINEWHKPFRAGFRAYNGGTIFVHFYKRMANVDLQLSVAGFTLRQIPIGEEFDGILIDPSENINSGVIDPKLELYDMHYSKITSTTDR